MLFIVILFCIFNKKMKNIYFLLFPFWSLLSYAQQPINLIPNGSFELKNSCPVYATSDSQTYNIHVLNWKSEQYMGQNFNLQKNSPDYYNACAPYDDETINSHYNVGVPYNFAGNQTAHTGDAYSGLFISQSGRTSTDVYYEYIFNELDEPLIAGEEYTFSMFLSLAENTSSHSINKIGAVFVENLPFFNQHITTQLMIGYNLSPQVYTTEILNNSNGWQEVRGSFIAQGGERYVILGVFEFANELQIEGIINQYIPGNVFSSYYYFDDVALYKGKILSNEEFNSQKIKIYPNPTNNLVTIEGITLEEIKTLELFDMKGVKLMGISNELKMDISSLASGSYLLKITNSEDNTLSKKIIKK